jgi:hypothetical protein
VNGRFCSEEDIVPPYPHKGLHAQDNSSCSWHLWSGIRVAFAVCTMVAYEVTSPLSHARGQPLQERVL